MKIFYYLYVIVLLVAMWRVFQKMGRQGWEGIIPCYNYYVLFVELYGNGWKFLLLLIPFYNIYVAIRCSIDLADNFHKSAGFGVGIAFLPPVFWGILAFGDATYLDGSQAVQGSDVISQTLDRATDAIQGNAPVSRKNENAMEKLKELNELLNQGIITEEEFNAKKEELLKRI